LQVDSDGAHIVGYFSKEKVRTTQWWYHSLFVRHGSFFVLL